MRSEASSDAEQPESTHSHVSLLAPQGFSNNIRCWSEARIAMLVFVIPDVEGSTRPWDERTEDMCGCTGPRETILRLRSAAGAGRDSTRAWRLL